MAVSGTGAPTPPTAQNQATAQNQPVDLWGIRFLGAIGLLGIVGLLIIGLLGQRVEYPGAAEPLAGVQAPPPAGEATTPAPADQQEQQTPPPDQQTPPPAGAEPAAPPGLDSAVAANAATSSGRVGLYGQLISALAAATTAAIGGIAGVIRRGGT